MTTRRNSSLFSVLALGGLLAACGGVALDTALDVKDVPRKPDGVLLEPAAAIPTPEERGKVQAGVVALRQPIGNEQIGELVKGYVHSYIDRRGQLSELLTDDAVLFVDNNRSSPRTALNTFMTQKWQAHQQDYIHLQRDVARLDRLERWTSDDLSPHTDPPRPPEMHAGDIYARVPLDQVLSSQGDPLFHNTLIVLIRRDADRKIKIAGLAETDTP